MNTNHMPVTARDVGTTPGQWPSGYARQIAEDMRLTAVQAEAIGPDAFAGTALLCAIHHMRDFVGMASALLACGADPRLMTIIDKGYPYAHRDQVDNWLREDLGATVVPYPDRAAGIAAHLDRAAAAGKRTLVFDDGGYVLPVVLTEMPDRVGEIVGVVEQTTSGITKLAPFGELPVPVFSVAESALKAAVEAPHVAASVVNAVVRLLPDETWAGQPALVLGYGRLGRQAARILRDTHRMRVAVYDTETVLLVTAHQDGYRVDRDLGALLREHQPLLVLGAAGAGSLQAAHADDFTASAYLVSMTSRDFEFPLPEWAQRARRVADYPDVGHCYLLDGGVDLCVLGDGLPLNFHHNESLPNRVSDLVIAALLLGGATLAQPDTPHGPGRDVALVDQILAASPVLAAYLDLYADEAARRLVLPDPDSQRDYTRSPWRYGPGMEVPTVEKVFTAGEDLAVRFAQHLVAVRGERTDTRTALPEVATERPEVGPGSVRVPHLVAVRDDAGQITDITIWEIMPAAGVEPWCGTRPDHRWYEDHLDGLLTIRRRLRDGTLPAGRAATALTEALAGGRYLSIRFAYQHPALIADLLAEVDDTTRRAA